MKKTLTVMATLALVLAGVSIACAECPVCEELTCADSHAYADCATAAAFNDIYTRSCQEDPSCYHWGYYVKIADIECSRTTCTCP